MAVTLHRRDSVFAHDSCPSTQGTVFSLTHGATVWLKFLLLCIIAGLVAAFSVVINPQQALVSDTPSHTHTLPPSRHRC